MKNKSCVNRVFSSCAQKKKQEESCIIVRCWINCFLKMHPKDFDWPVHSHCLKMCLKKRKENRLKKCFLDVNNYVYPVQFQDSVSRLTRKRYAFLQIRWIIHKCLTIGSGTKAIEQESAPVGIWKRCFIFLLGTKKTLNCCLCLVQEVLHTLMPFQ